MRPYLKGKLMFNRVLQVRWVKNPRKQAQPDVKETEVEGKTAILAHSFTKSILTVVVGGCAYVALDTARQVLVAQANKV